MKIGLIGAIDRYNYGDILFPLVVENELRRRLNKSDNFSFVYYASKKNDLTNIGGNKTRPLSSLKLDNVDVAIVVGGEVLTATWNRTYLHTLNSHFKVLVSRILNKIRGFYRSEQYYKSKFNLADLKGFPWVIDKRYYGVHKVLYNAVSGTDFEFIKGDLASLYRDQMKQADFISVRDPLTQSNLEKVGIETPYLFPDSAFKISDIFTKDILKTKINNTNFVGLDDYIVFQVGKDFARGNNKNIIKELEKVIDITDKKIVLLPIGMAAMHEDYIPLKKILKGLQKNYSNKVLYITGNIFDIMYTISKADLFIGTSLHGNITALSYGVPSIGLDARIPKLREFLKYFSIDGQQYDVNYDEISSAALIALEIDKTELSANACKLKKQVDKNFDLIASVLRK